MRSSPPRPACSGTNFYGTNAQRYALQKANKGVALKEGAVITLPEKLGKDTLILSHIGEIPYSLSRQIPNSSGWVGETV